MPTTHVPDAIVYIPGLTGESVELTALRLAAALNRGAASPGADFQMGVGQDEVYDAELKLTTRLRPITRLEPGKDPLHIVDVYAFSYFETLTRDHVKSNELVKALRMALQFIRGVPRMIGAFFWHPQVSARAKAQYIAAILILLLLVVYLGVLVYAIVETIQQIPLVQTAFPAPAEASGDVDPATGAVGSLGWAQVIIIGTALLEAFFPQIRKAILDAAVKYLSVVGYLDHEEQLRAVGGQLNALMDRVAAKGYRHLYVVGFSFGSVIACNAFFPPGLQPAPRFREADALVTIGCPYDMITVFWPHYFAGRTIEAGVPKQWVNIYSPRDILASEFCRPATAAATNAQQPPAAAGWQRGRRTSPDG